MSRRSRSGSVLELGHDAFLDIVANLVGILIILVVVLGTQSAAIIEEIQDQSRTDVTQGASQAQLAELAQQSMRAAAAQADSNRIEKTVRHYQLLIERRQQQRGMLLDLLAQVESAWEEKQKELDRQSTRAAKLATEYEQASQRLSDLKSEGERLQNQSAPVVTLAHLPTPMAKTVFGDELHFRLKQNRLSVVPVDQLIDEIRRDFGRVAGDSRNGLMDSAVGPINGYVARYEMSKNREMVARGGRVAMATRVELVRMTVEPLDEPFGQPVDQVLQDRGLLDIQLAGRQPATTTITVWVYPDSFAAYRKLKEQLYRRGFATAARPLPDDKPISGSPHGSRSRAQ